MNWENVSDLVVAVVTSVASVVAIFISASISRKAERENHKRQFLSEAYSNLFTRYVQWLETEDSQEKGALLAAIEQARLLSSQETEALLRDFERIIIRDTDKKELGKKLGQLRQAMKSELQQPEKKASKKRKKQDAAHK